MDFVFGTHNIHKLPDILKESLENKKQEIEVYSKEGNKIVENKIDGYLEIGLIDTMKDLVVNFIGALVFSIFGFLYILNRDKYKFINHFIVKKGTA